MSYRAYISPFFFSLYINIHTYTTILEYREKYPGADEDELRVYMRAEIKESQNQMAEKASAVTGVTMKVEDLQRENSDAFQIPEWFLYTSRAFLTLEGISLQADSDFSIVK